MIHALRDGRPFFRSFDPPPFESADYGVVRVEIRYDHRNPDEALRELALDQLQSKVLL